MPETLTSSRLFIRTALVWLLVLPVLFYGLYVGGHGWLSADLHNSSNKTLSLYVSGLEELLNRYKALPEIYALHPTVQGILETPNDPGLRQQANILLEKFNRSSKAADTYILDTGGTTLAASNWNKPITFVGRNFSFRPYFNDAMETGEGRFFALGTTSGLRGYYISKAVIDVMGMPIGVVVVKIDVSQAEKVWGSQAHNIIVTDNAGIVFLSSKLDWLYNSIGELSSEALAELGQTRRYADKSISRLPFSVEDSDAPWHHTFKPNQRSDVSYLATYQDISEAGWRIWILADTSPLFTAAIAYAFAIVLIIAMAAIAVVSLIERRRGLLRALNVQQRARLTLEDSSNELERQVEKRTVDLKRTQNELVQAGKMAALGQMSMGINHELNQPLTAIRSYTDNAAKFLDQNRPDEARENLSLISALSERMGGIILRLKIFARESSDERKAVSLQAVVSDSMRIVEPRLKKEKVDFSIDIPRSEITVLVNEVRLEQVLVNLINNANDALPDDGERRIEIEARIQGGEAVVRVRDTGRGIPDDIITRLFEPFFTTKEVGIGLGLGLSISTGIIQEFGGELVARNLEEGGAEFSFNIPLAADRLELP
ncbi:MAG TPA: ATP-binding protein [Rhodospirillales bacterium]|nr:ATP-binding protein [Rhodospirillales bacterium]